MIRIYSKDNCPWCDRAKDLMNVKEEEYTEIKIGCDITREELDVRRGTEVEYGNESSTSSDQYSEVISKLSELNVDEFSRKIDEMQSFISSVIGDVKSSYDSNYRMVNTADNPNNLPEEQVNKLTEIYMNLKDVGSNLFNIEQMLES